jgi:large subunit ribosomal protein L1
MVRLQPPVAHLTPRPCHQVGTLTDNLAAAIGELRQGRVEFRMDRTGVVHAPIGRVTFEAPALYANMGALTAALLAAKPDAIKGGLPKYVRSVHVCSTMGRSVAVEVSSLAAAVDAAAAAMAGKSSPAAQT